MTSSWKSSREIITEGPLHLVDFAGRQTFSHDAAAPSTRAAGCHIDPRFRTLDFRAAGRTIPVVHQVISRFSVPAGARVKDARVVSGIALPPASRPMSSIAFVQRAVRLEPGSSPSFRRGRTRCCPCGGSVRPEKAGVATAPGGKHDLRMASQVQGVLNFGYLCSTASWKPVFLDFIFRPVPVVPVPGLAGSASSGLVFTVTAGTAVQDLPRQKASNRCLMSGSRAGTAYGIPRQSGAAVKAPPWFILMINDGRPGCGCSIVTETRAYVSGGSASVLRPQAPRRTG